MTGKALEIGTQGLLVTLLPRLLGPAEFGRLSVALAIVTIGAVAMSLGAPASFARFVPAAPEHLRVGTARSLTIKLLPLRTAQMSIAVLAAVVLVMARPGSFPPRDAALVVVALGAEVGALLMAQIALGLGATWIWSYRLSARNVALLLLVPAFAALGWTVDVMWTVALGSAAGLAFAFVLVWPLVRHAAPGAPVPDGAMRFGRVSGLALLVGQVTYRGPVLAASIGGLAPEDVGYAGLAASIAMAGIYAVRELFMVSVPELVDCWSRDPSEADRRLRRLGWRVQSALIAGSILGAVALEQVLPMVVGDAFAPATRALALVLATFPLVPLSALATPASALRLTPGVPLRIDAIALGVFVVFAFLLVPRYAAAGAMGAMLAAVATSALFSVTAIPTVVTLRMLVTGLLGSGAVAGAGVLVRNVLGS